MPRTFVIGDIHGAHQALLQCFKRSNFDYQYDSLICLGDVCDGWPETRQCIDELLKVKNLIYILGNHDFWTLEWMDSGYAESTWLSQGGEATVSSYHDHVPESHKAFLRSALPYYEKDNALFVHAGIRPDRKLESQGLNTFLWDRTLALMAMDFHAKGIDAPITKFDAVYIGHTPVPEKYPIKCCEVWMMDSGAGWSGRLSMMDINSMEIFTSDVVPELYPGVPGRSRY